MLISVSSSAECSGCAYKAHANFMNFCMKNIPFLFFLSCNLKCLNCQLNFKQKYIYFDFNDETPTSALFSMLLFVYVYDHRNIKLMINQTSFKSNSEENLLVPTQNSNKKRAKFRENSLAPPSSKVGEDLKLNV